MMVEWAQNAIQYPYWRGSDAIVGGVKKSKSKQFSGTHKVSRDIAVSESVFSVAFTITKAGGVHARPSIMFIMDDFTIIKWTNV